MIKLAVLFFLILPSWAQKPCLSGRFRYVNNKKKELVYIDICKSKNFYISKSCYKKTCSLKKRLVKTSYSYNPIGSPHYNFCLKIGGYPISGQVLDLWSKEKKWKDRGFCFDKNKKDFFDFDYIIKNKIVKK